MPRKIPSKQPQDPEVTESAAPESVEEVSVPEPGQVEAVPTSQCAEVLAEVEPEIPAVYRCPADLESANREIEVAREKVLSIEAQISEAVAVRDHDLESRYRGQCRAARQALSSLELHKSRMEA